MGKALVYERVRDPALDREILLRLTLNSLRKLYAHRNFTVSNSDGAEITKSEAEWWSNHRKRRTYLDGVTFDPTGRAPDTFWNLWTGFGVEPAPGDWSLLREHVQTVICRGDAGQLDYLLNWAARMFQHPTEPGHVAIVIRGKKGAGKGIYLSALARAFGGHAIHIHDLEHLAGRFNAHLRDCVFLFADEAFFAADRKHEGALKGLITEQTLPIEGKGQNLVSAKNMLHIAMASNNDWVVPASHDERRYAIFDALDNKLGDRKYFKAIAEQLEAGGLAGMIHDLLRLDIANFEVRDFPDTDGLVEQKMHSLDTLDRWWLAVLERGFIWRSRYGIIEFGKWTEFVSTELLHRSYHQWCDDERVQRRASRVEIGKRMTEVYQSARPDGNHVIGEIESATPGFLDHDVIVRANRPPGYVLDVLSIARARFSDQRGVVGDWGIEP